LKTVTEQFAEHCLETCGNEKRSKGCWQADHSPDWNEEGSNAYWAIRNQVCICERFKPLRHVSILVEKMEQKLKASGIIPCPSCECSGFNFPLDELDEEDLASDRYPCRTCDASGWMYQLP